MQEDCSRHPYFALTEDLSLFAMPTTFIVSVLLILVGGVIWIWTRSGVSASILVPGVLMLAARFAIVADPGFVLRWQIGTDDLAKLQRELQMQEADLERYGRERPGLSNKQIVKDFLADDQRPIRFYFMDPAVPPVFIKASSWRDRVARVVVSFVSASRSRVATRSSRHHVWVREEGALRRSEFSAGASSSCRAVRAG